MALCQVHSVATAQAGEALTCATSDAAFDRPGPFLPGIIVGGEGEHIRLYRRLPSECSSIQARACEGKAYLIPGDRVELAGACGRYAHVRYIGTSRTSIGWVELSALHEGPAAVGGHPPAAATGRSANAPPTSDILADNEGYYTATGTCWVRRAPGEPAEPCGSSADSCLIIRKLDALHAQLRIESFQTQGHECGVTGVAELRGHTLVYVQKEQHDQDDGNGLSIDLLGPELKIRYTPESHFTFVNPFCAINASLERLAFKKSERESAAGNTCGEAVYAGPKQ